MSADVIAYLEGGGGKRPAIALDSDAILDAFTLINLINEANDQRTLGHTIELAISAIDLAELKRRGKTRFELWLAVLRAKNIVVKGFDEHDVTASAPTTDSLADVSPKELIREQVTAEGSLRVTREAPRADDPLLQTSPEEALAAAEELLRLRAALRTVRDANATHDAKVGALATLVEAGSAELPELLAEELERTEMVSAWRDALIFAIEHTQVTDATLRARVIASLLRHARALRDEGSEGPLWSAVRRYASMVPVEASDGLLEFLRPEDATTTKQVALQGIFNIFSVERDRECSARDRLRARVHALAVERTIPAELVTPEQAALSFCCLQAAAVLEDPELAEVLARLESLNRRRLTQRAHEFLAALKLERGGGAAK